MKIICVEEHAIDPATDKAARPAVLDEAPCFGLMDSPNAGWSTTRTSRWTAPVNSSGILLVSEQDREKIAHLNAEKLFTL